jgi:hypothetical protein
MARASTYTLLSLDRWAKIMGVTGAHFNQGAGANDVILPIVGDCGDMWWQYAWQNADQVSREDLAMAIADAEHDIANELGYWPAPMWIENEIHRYPRPYRPDLYGVGLNVRWQQKSVTAKFGKIIQAGRRATSEITSDVAVVYSDPDGDGYNELATVTTPTTLTDRCEIKCYFDGHGGEQIWEIRPPKSVVISGGNVTFTFDAWQLFDPNLWEALPTNQDGLSAIDITVAGNYVSTVDVYREFTDFTANSSQFMWERTPINTLSASSACCSSCGGSGCIACTLITQDGCLHIRDVDNGILVPVPAIYDDTDEQWETNVFTECREPDQVLVWYYAGNLSQNWFQETTCDPLDNSLANCIAWMATARLERPICACNNSQALSMDLKRDMSFTPPEGGSFFVSESDLDNPFGTRVGEIKAWRKISKLVERTPAVASI